MPNGTPTRVAGFTVKLGASGPGRASPQVRLPLVVKFYNFGHGRSAATPYVGTLDLHQALVEQRPQGHFRIPRRGHVQVRYKRVCWSMLTRRVLTE